MIDITDILPTASGQKRTSCVTEIDKPGGQVSFQVEVINDTIEPIDVTDLFDDTHGDLNGQGTCTVPQN